MEFWRPWQKGSQDESSLSTFIFQQTLKDNAESTLKRRRIWSWTTSFLVTKKCLRLLKRGVLKCRRSWGDRPTFFEKLKPLRSVIVTSKPGLNWKPSLAEQKVVVEGQAWKCSRQQAEKGGLCNEDCLAQETSQCEKRAKDWKHGSNSKTSAAKKKVAPSNNGQIASDGTHCVGL